jgi:hypothetical protein
MSSDGAFVTVREAEATVATGPDGPSNFSDTSQVPGAPTETDEAGGALENSYDKFGSDPLTPAPDWVFL